MRESDYNIPNITMASFQCFKDTNYDKHLRLGYWGDIVTGPFLSFGVQCEYPEVFKLMNRLHYKSAIDRSQYNLMSMIYEITTHNQYPLKPRSSNEDEISTDLLIDCEDFPDEIDTSFFEIKFLSLQAFSNQASLNKFKNQFDVVYAGCALSHVLTPDFLNLCLNEDSNLILESPQFVLDLKPELIPSYHTKFDSIFSKTSLQKCETSKIEDTNYCLGLGPQHNQLDCFTFYSTKA